MKNIFSLFFIVVMTVSCRGPKEKTGSPQVFSDAQKQEMEFSSALEHEEVFFTISRTPCFGTCPVDRLMIFRSGQAIYEGKEHVEHIGKFKTVFTAEEIEEIKARAIEIGYFELEDSYDMPVTDFPTTFTSLRINDQVKHIENRAGAPQGLDDFQNLVIVMLKRKKLQKID